MGDFSFAEPSNAGFDWASDGQDLLVGDGLLTMVIHALFRDATAPSGSIPQGQDPRGHWATGLSPDAPEGSLLWLLTREKITPDMPHRIADELERACQFLVEARDGPARDVVRVRASAEKAGPRGLIAAQLQIFLAERAQPRRLAFTYDPVAGRYLLEDV